MKDHVYLFTFLLEVGNTDEGSRSVSMEEVWRTRGWKTRKGGSEDWSVGSVNGGGY